MYLPKEWGGEENKEEEEEVGHFQLSTPFNRDSLSPYLPVRSLCSMCYAVVALLFRSIHLKGEDLKENEKEKKAVSLCVSKKRSDFLPPMTGCDENIVNYSTFADLILPTTTIHCLFLLPPFLFAVLSMISWYKRSCVNQINDCHISLSDHIPVFVIFQYSP